MYMSKQGCKLRHAQIRNIWMQHIYSCAKEHVMSLFYKKLNVCRVLYSMFECAIAFECWYFFLFPYSEWNFFMTVTLENVLSMKKTFVMFFPSWNIYWSILINLINLGIAWSTFHFQICSHITTQYFFTFIKIVFLIFLPLNKK